MNGVKKNPSNTVILKAFRSKKSGLYFKFEQYYDDGFGKYDDTVNDTDVACGNLPDLFPLDTTGRCFYEFIGHTPEEIEEVKFTIKTGS